MFGICFSGFCFCVFDLGLGSFFNERCFFASISKRIGNKFGNPGLMFWCSMFFAYEFNHFSMACPARRNGWGKNKCDLGGLFFKVFTGKQDSDKRQVLKKWNPPHNRAVFRLSHPPDNQATPRFYPVLGNINRSFSKNRGLNHTFRFRF